MKEKEFLNSLTGTVEQNAPSFIVYASHNSERLRYSCDFIFRQLLRSQHQITSDESLFAASPLYRINYSDLRFPYAFNVKPSGLLSETGVNEEKPECALKEGMLNLYPVSAEDYFHFDIFSAVFYLISRYEEWQDFQRDRHGRFELKESILYKHGFHQKPIIEQWGEDFKAALQRQFELLHLPERTFHCIASIDVDNLYAYRAKGAVRTAGAAIRDLLKFDFENFSRRRRVLNGREKDPFDIYESFQDFCNQHQLSALYFFLIHTGNEFDRSVDTESGAFEPVIETLRGKGAITGLHPSYYSIERPDVMQEEVKKFTLMQKSPVQFSRQHYLRFDIRSTPPELLKNRIAADFSMGFASGSGFRAGTTQPFRYYDLKSEKATPLLFVPFCAMDGAYFVYSKQDPAKAMKELLMLKEEIRKLKGNFITVFHERTFAEHLYPGYGELLKKVLLA